MSLQMNIHLPSPIKKFQDTQKLKLDSAFLDNFIALSVEHVA